MKNLLFLLSALFLLLLAPATPAAAQKFHRAGHSNRSMTIKSERSNPHVTRRAKGKEKADKKRNERSLKRKRRQDEKRNKKRRSERQAGGLENGQEAVEPKESSN